jgi:hypothetical protein
MGIGKFSGFAAAGFACLMGQMVSLPVSAELIKQSSSGICHSPQSSWYERTKNFSAYESIDVCLAAGGRLPKNAGPGRSKLVVIGAGAEYSRSAFGSGWADNDRDCQNSRAEALIDQSTTSVRFADAKRCRVITGRWVSSFTGSVIQNASDIDIDHVVPLAYSWDRGASDWPGDKRKRFANDPVNLLPVELSLNRQKGARGPDEWLPPAGQCGYVARFFRIVKMYQLTLAAEETTWVRSFLANCGG